MPFAVALINEFVGIRAKCLEDRSLENHFLSSPCISISSVRIWERLRCGSRDTPYHKWTITYLRQQRAEGGLWHDTVMNMTRNSCFIKVLIHESLEFLAVFSVVRQDTDDHRSGVLLTTRYAEVADVFATHSRLTDFKLVPPGPT